jgi:hypothetical protein
MVDTRTQVALQNPRVPHFQKVPFSRYFMPEEGLEPTTFGL